jgi:hypothetical protein
MKMQATVTLNTLKNSVAELKKVLENIPDDAEYHVRSYAGDRPWESGSQTITFNWEV